LNITEIVMKKMTKMWDSVKKRKLLTTKIIIFPGINVLKLSVFG